MFTLSLRKLILVLTLSIFATPAFACPTDPVPTEPDVAQIILSILGLG
jgi:hypothetical protein